MSNRRVSSESVREKGRGRVGARVQDHRWGRYTGRQAQRSVVCVRPVVLHCTGGLLPAPDDWSRGDRHGNEVARLNRDHLLLDEFAGEVLAEVSALHRVVGG